MGRRKRASYRSRETCRKAMMKKKKKKMKKRKNNI